MKKFLSMFMAFSMLVTSTGVTAFANDSSISEGFDSEIIELDLVNKNVFDILETEAVFSNYGHDVENRGVLSFDSVNEDVLDVFAKIHPLSNLDDVKITEKVDAYGNTMFIAEVVVNETAFNEITLRDMASIFSADPTLNSMLIDDSTLVYTLPNGIEGKMIETINPDGTRSLRTIEGEKDQEILIDPIKQQLLIDGELVTVAESLITVIYQESYYAFQAFENWRWVTRQELTWRAPTPISELAVGVLLAGIGVVLRPWVGFGVSAGAAFITFMIAHHPGHHYAYIARNMYVWGPTARFVDGFYSHATRRPHQRGAMTTTYRHE